MAFNVAKIASARVSLTISLTKSLRVAGPLVRNEEFSKIAVIKNCTVLKKKHSYMWGGGAGSAGKISR